jgi:hypothetical protein
MGFFYPQWQKIIRIGVTTPPTTTGYQVKVEIPWQPGMRDDFADLRFSDYYRTLPYWIETSTTRVTATVWIKLTEINEACREFFCYYGNGAAVSESSGTNTFDFFDDFSDLSYASTPVWTVEAGTWSAAGGTLKSTSTITPTTIRTPFSVSKPFALKLKCKCLASGALYPAVDATTRATGWAVYVSSANPILLQSKGITIITSSWTVDTNWHKLDVTYDSSSLFSLYFDGVFKGSATNTDSASFTNIRAETHAVANQEFDDIIIRKFQTTEPTCTPAESGINTAFYQALLRAKHVIQESYPYTLAVSFVTDHMHLTWTEP